MSDRSSPRPAITARHVSQAFRRPPRPSGRRIRTIGFVCALGVLLAGCGPRRAAVIGPVLDAAATATALERRTELREPLRIDFDWALNEQGRRLRGVGVARIEPPYRARLDLFLDNREGILSAAVVDDELRLQAGAPDDILPPIDLLWAALGVFRPVYGASLEGGDRLEGSAERLRYRQSDGHELHYELSDGRLSAVELLEGDALLQWVRLERSTGARFPERATYRNLQEFRELKIERTALAPAGPFDPRIWDPR